MGLIRLVQESIYSPIFYNGLLVKPLSFSFKYFYSFALVLSIVLAAVISYALIPPASSFFQTVGPKILAYYPDELVITVSGGKASTNVEEPHFFPWPSELREADGTAPFENLLVINTIVPFSLEQFRSYRTAALLTQDSFIYAGDKGEIRIQPLAGVPDGKLDKRFVATVTERIAPFSKFVAPIIVIGAFLAGLALFSFELAYLLFGALLIWLLLRVKKVRVQYWKAYQIGMHAVTLGLLFQALMFAFGLNVRLPFLFTALMLVVAFVNVRPVPVGTPTVPAQPVP